MQVSLFLRQERSWLELMYWLGSLKFSFLEVEEKELDEFTLAPTVRAEQLSFGVIVKIPLPLSPLNRLLGDGDLKVLLIGREYEGLNLSGSLRKLFCRVSAVGEFDRTLLCGVDVFTFCGIDCCIGATTCFAGEPSFLEYTFGDASNCDRSLIELMRIMCGFSLTHDHKNSLENDRSFEFKIEDPLESDEHELIVVVLLLVQQVKAEPEEDVDVVGEGGDGEILFDTGAGILGVFGAWEITSLSSTLLPWHSSKERFLGLHLLMQQPILLDLKGMKRQLRLGLQT